MTSLFRCEIVALLHADSKLPVNSYTMSGSRTWDLIFNENTLTGQFTYGSTAIGNIVHIYDKNTNELKGNLIFKKSMLSNRHIYDSSYWHFDFQGSIDPPVTVNVGDIMEMFLPPPYEVIVSTTNLFHKEFVFVTFKNTTSSSTIFDISGNNAKLMNGTTQTHNISIASKSEATFNYEVLLNDTNASGTIILYHTSIVSETSAFTTRTINIDPKYVITSNTNKIVGSETFSITFLNNTSSNASFNLFSGTNIDNVSGSNPITVLANTSATNNYQAYLTILDISGEITISESTDTAGIYSKTFSVSPAFVIETTTTRILTSQYIYLTFTNNSTTTDASFPIGSGILLSNISLYHPGTSTPISTLIVSKDSVLNVGYQAFVISDTSPGSASFTFTNDTRITKTIDVYPPYIIQTSDSIIPSKDFVSISLTNYTLTTARFNISSTLATLYDGQAYMDPSFIDVASDAVQNLSFQPILHDPQVQGSFGLFLSTNTDISTNVVVIPQYVLQSYDTNLLNTEYVHFTLTNNTTNTTTFDFSLNDMEIYNDSNVSLQTIDVSSKTILDVSLQVFLNDPEISGAFVLSHPEYPTQIIETVSVRPQYILQPYNDSLLTTEYVHFTFTNNTTNMTHFDFSLNGLKIYNDLNVSLGTVPVYPESILDISFQVILDDPEISGSLLLSHASFPDDISASTMVKPQYILNDYGTTELLNTETVNFTLTNNTLDITTFSFSFFRMELHNANGDSITSVDVGAESIRDVSFVLVLDHPEISGTFTLSHPAYETEITSTIITIPQYLLSVNTESLLLSDTILFTLTNNTDHMTTFLLTFDAVALYDSLGSLVTTIDVAATTIMDISYSVELANKNEPGSFVLYHPSDTRITETVVISPDYAINSYDTLFLNTQTVNFTLNNSTNDTTTFELSFNKMSILDTNLDPVLSIDVGPKTVANVQYQVLLDHPEISGSFILSHPSHEDIQEQITVIPQYIIQSYENQILSTDFTLFTLTNNTDYETHFVFSLNNLSVNNTDGDSITFVKVLPTTIVDISFQAILTTPEISGTFILAHPSDAPRITETILVEPQYILQSYVSELLTTESILFTLTNNTLIQTTFDVSTNQMVLLDPYGNPLSQVLVNRETVLDASFQVVLDDPQVSGSFVLYHNTYPNDVRETAVVNPQYTLQSYQSTVLTTEYVLFTLTNNTLVQTTFDLSFHQMALLLNPISSIDVLANTVLDISYQVILDHPEISGSFVLFHPDYSDEVRETVVVEPQYVLDSYQTNVLTTEYVSFTFTNNTANETTFPVGFNPGAFSVKLYSNLDGSVIDQQMVPAHTTLDVSYQVLLDHPEITSTFRFIHPDYSDKVRETVIVNPQYMLQSYQSNYLTTEYARFTFTNNTLSQTTFDLSIYGLTLYNRGGDLVSNVVVNGSTILDISYQIILDHPEVDGSFVLYHPDYANEIRRPVFVKPQYMLNSYQSNALTSEYVSFTFTNHTLNTTTFEFIFSQMSLLDHTNQNISSMDISASTIVDLSYQVLLDHPEISGSLVLYHPDYSDKVRETVIVNPQYVLDSYQTNLLTTEYARFTFTNNTLTQTTFDLSTNGLTLYNSGGDLVSNVVVNGSTIMDISYQVLLDHPEISGSFVWFHPDYTEKVREMVSVDSQYRVAYEIVGTRDQLQSNELLSGSELRFTLTNHTNSATTFELTFPDITLIQSTNLYTNHLTIDVSANSNNIYTYDVLLFTNVFENRNIQLVHSTVLSILRDFVVIPPFALDVSETKVPTDTDVVFTLTNRTNQTTSFEFDLTNVELYDTQDQLVSKLDINALTIQNTTLNVRLENANYSGSLTIFNSMIPSLSANIQVDKLVFFELDTTAVAGTVSTTLLMPVQKGDTVLEVANVSDFQIGMQITIGTGAQKETRVIVGFGSLILDSPLTFNHPSNTPIVAEFILDDTTIPLLFANQHPTLESIYDVSTTNVLFMENGASITEIRVPILTTNTRYFSVQLLDRSVGGSFTITNRTNSSITNTIRVVPKYIIDVVPFIFETTPLKITYTNNNTIPTKFFLTPDNARVLDNNKVDAVQVLVPAKTILTQTYTLNTLVKFVPASLHIRNEHIPDIESITKIVDQSQIVHSYSIQATKEGTTNYLPLVQTFPIYVLLATRPDMVDISTNIAYSPQYRSYLLPTFSLTDRIVYSISGDITGVDISYGNTQTYLVYSVSDISFTLQYSITNPNYYISSGSFPMTIYKETVENLYTRGESVYFLKQDPNYTIQEIAAPRLYTVLELILGGFQLKELKEVGYNACDVYASKRYTLRDLERVGYRMRYCLR